MTEPRSGTSPKRGDESEDIEHLVFECLERYASGGETAVEEVCRSHPEQASEIRQMLETIWQLGLGPSEPGALADGTPASLGEYRILRTLGSGGMGVVYLAEQETLHRRVALKLIRPELLYFPTSRERFHREAAAVARLQHPGIVPIHAVGEEHGIPYFTMDLIAGCTLAAALQDLSDESPRSLSGRDLQAAVMRLTAHPEAAPHPAMGEQVFAQSWTVTCLQLVRQVALALDHAHSRGVLHRDVKSSNLMVTQTGRVMLTDFGLARAEGIDPVTRSSTQVGSLPYMSPEQVRGEVDDLDVRTDVFSLGVVLFECLTLRHPFIGSTPNQLSCAILEQTAPALGKFHPKVSPDLQAVVDRALEKDRERRYPTARAFADDLTALLEGRAVSARRTSLVGKATRWARRRPAVAALVAVLVIGIPAVAGLAGYLIAKLPDIRSGEEVREGQELDGR